MDTANPVAARAAGPGSAHSVFIAWERLRIPYNVLLAVVVVVCAHGELTNPSFWAYLAKAAVAANFSFCAGASGEGYLALLGFERRPSRLALFGIGCCLASLATIIALLPDMNEF